MREKICLPRLMMTGQSKEEALTHNYLRKNHLSLLKQQRLRKKHHR
ncbi:hypothetical protein N9L68_02410 [bacterium]|nr:hypothetical protein [bacterium]